MPVIKFMDRNGNIVETHVNQIISIDGKAYQDYGSEVDELKDRMLRMETQVEVMLGAMYASGQEEDELTSG